MLSAVNLRVAMLIVILLSALCYFADCHDAAS